MFKFFRGVSVSFSPFNLGKSHIYILSLGWRSEMWKQKLNQFLLKYSISLLHSSIIFATLGPESLQGSNMQPLLAKVFFFFFFFSFFFFKFYFIFKLYIIVLVLPNIKMNPPQVYKVLISPNTSENVKQTKKKQTTLSYIVKQSVSIYSINFFFVLIFVEIVSDKKTHVQPTVLS